jgi:hypothetical protein
MRPDESSAWSLAATAGGFAALGLCRLCLGAKYLVDIPCNPL